jgi:pyrimidine-nucleoside phosphorylase
MTPLDIICRKRDGMHHTQEEIHQLVEWVVDGTMTDDQVGAWLMAAFLNGISPEERLALTLAMRDSGERLDLSGIPGYHLDKHSTGGVGDKTTLVVAPILAACGVPILKMSGRGLGHSGGTIDKLEAIPGFQTTRTPEEAVQQVARVGLALIGQSDRLAPADRRLYAIRDTTGTIESIGLIASSILSKKLACSPHGLLLDVKVGAGAFMKNAADALLLAETLVEIGRGAGVHTAALLTDMSEPLGLCVGNSLEVAEACRLLTGGGPVDLRFRDVCLALAARGLMLSGTASHREEAERLALTALESGSAARRLELAVEAQGGDPRIVENPDRLPVSKLVRRVRAERKGTVQEIDALEIGRLCVELGAGRLRRGDSIDHGTGVVLHRKRGDTVAVGDPIADIYMRTEADAERWASRVRSAFEIEDYPAEPRSVLLGMVPSGYVA